MLIYTMLSCSTTRGHIAVVKLEQPHPLLSVTFELVELAIMARSLEGLLGKNGFIVSLSMIFFNSKDY